jgi:soluble lytic murein transglycosylase
VTRFLVVVAVIAAVVVGVGAVVTTKPDWYLRARYPLKYEPIIQGHARNYHLEPALIAAVIYRESKFDAHAGSKAGALGLMQLTPATAKGIALRTGGTRFELSDLYNPELNVRYGCWYLRHLLDTYDGNVRKALAAYNGGRGNVERGVMYPETKEYVNRVLAARDAYRKAYPELRRPDT